MSPKHLATIALAASLALLASGCTERTAIWDTSIDEPLITRGLGHAAAIIDAPAERALLLPVSGELEIAPVSIPIGKSFAAAQPSSDGSRLMVLTRGVVPRRTADDEAPALTVIADDSPPAVEHRYQLGDPLSGLAVDPEGQFAVLFAGAGDDTFVQNPNELIFVDLDAGPGADNPFPFTLRSFGGRPQSLRFTSELDVPGGKRRLLVVLTDRDVVLVNLHDLTLPDITIPLTDSAQTLSPGAIAISDGDPQSDSDTRIAISIEGDSSVIVVDLLPLSAEQSDSPQSFRAMPNVVFVGGVPSDIEFVQTDGGLRLAALVPAQQSLTLIDPATGIASQIPLGAPFQSMSLITNVVGGTDQGSDVALLWSSSSSQIAFVELGATVGSPYKAVDLLQLDKPVGQVVDVPDPNQHLKLLRSTNGRSLVVLDLLARTAAPIAAASSDTAVAVSPDGLRAWISGSNNLAQLDLASLHPLNLILSHRVHSVFDITRGDDRRALVALHDVGAIGATVLDAEHPSLAGSREYVGVLLGGLQ